MKHSVQVTILGQAYTVRSDSEPQDVRQVAEFVNQRILEAQGSAGAANSYAAVVLALLNVAGELFQLKQHGQEVEVAQQRLQALLSRLEADCAAVADRS